MGIGTFHPDDLAYLGTDYLREVFRNASFDDSYEVDRSSAGVHLGDSRDIGNLLDRLRDPVGLDLYEHEGSDHDFVLRS